MVLLDAQPIVGISTSLISDILYLYMFRLFAVFVVLLLLIYVVYMNDWNSKRLSYTNG